MHKKEKDKRIADKVKSVLAYDDEFSISQIALFLQLSTKQVSRYLDEYHNNDKNKFFTLKHKGSNTRLTKEQIEWLEEHLNERTYSKSSDVCRLIKNKFNIIYSEKHMVKLLKSWKFVFKKTHIVPGKANSEKQEEFKKTYWNMKSRLLVESACIYFLDGIHPKHNAKSSWGWIKKGKRQQLKSNTGRKRLNIMGGIRITEDDINLITTNHDTINADAVIEILTKIEQANPNMKKIYVILDNARYHRAKKVKEFLENSRIELVFLPSYSPNLNLIERLWKFMYEQILNNQYYEKFEEFKSGIFGFLNNIGQFKEKLLSRLADNFQIIGA